MNSDFYPDVIEAGGLATALEQCAAQFHIPLTVISNPGGNSGSIAVASTAPGRLPLEVFARTESRAFQVMGRSGGVDIVTGVTADLREVAEAGAAWGAGTAVPRMREAFPFLQFDPVAEAHEAGPAAAVAAQWGILREKARDTPEFPQFAAVLEAAYAEPRLRALFPYTSHWTVAFSSSTGRPHRCEVAIAPQYGGGPYLVLRYPNTGVHGRAATAEQAVALAVAHLPDSVGPATTRSAPSPGRE
ncbi:DUF6193 family natural product biosynthesis protein [Streptomyces sp. NPDC060184]|uniref:DUF6193 family natural product biosynthesis protein n=1 Tax=Streptomyces sp. NPDC060184 TaxID=3347064 RepID=UPI00364D6F23